MIDLISGEVGRQDRQQRIGRLRFAASLTRGGSRGGFPRSNSVLVRGSYRYHSGRQAKSNAGGRMRSHAQYLAGQRQDQVEKGTDKLRQLYDDKGRETEWQRDADRHQDAFIEHRIILSTKDAREDDLHVLSQAAIQEIRSMNPQAEITASYAIHQDTDHPHSHLLLTSPNRVHLGREDYTQLRESAAEMRQELDREFAQGRAHSNAMDGDLGRDQIHQDNQHEMEMER